MSIKNYSAKGFNETPFNPQLEHFDFICGQIIKENRIYKYVVVMACLSFFISICITIFAISRPDSIPVLVTMNDFGETRYVGEVTKKNYQGFNVPENAITYQVKKFINLYKSLSTDKIIAKKNVENLYHMLTSTSAMKYSNLIKENNPFKNFGESTNEVFFETEPLKISNDTYQVDYKIRRRSLDGYVLNDIRERAVISIKTLEPASDDIKENPLGIYVVDFDIKEIQ